jgi:hypothetical protein
MNRDLFLYLILEVLEILSTLSDFFCEIILQSGALLWVADLKVEVDPVMEYYQNVKGEN